MKAIKKGILVSLVLAVVSVGSLSALDFAHGNDSIQPGNILISGAFGFGNFYPAITYSDISTLLGGTLAVEYTLPVAGLTVGVETGYLGSKVAYSSSINNAPDYGIGIIPLLARVGYHPDIGVHNLDVYAAAKVGYGLGFWVGSDASDIKDVASNPAGLGYGADVGVRYFFTKNIGVFAEGGYEYYFLDYTYDMGWLGELDWAAYGNKFVSAGVTFKF
jgi:hypothetical protein